VDPIADTVGTEIYTAHYYERRTGRWALGILGVVACFEMAVIVQLAGRPVVTRYIRIDEAGRAMPIAYNDLDYSPREGEIRTFLTDWATLRYTRLAATMAKTYPKNYYFLNEALAQSLMSADLKNRTVALVAAGQTEENDVQINNVTFTSLGKERIRNAPAYTDTAIIDLFKTFAATTPARREHWQVSVTFYLNPGAVSERAKTAPEFEIVNPLGLIITEFHESRGAW
jgi:type IV secretion system protein VirB5